MHAIQTDIELYGVFKELFEQLQAAPQLGHDFAHSNLVVRIKLTEPIAEVLLDGRQPPIEVFYGPSPGDTNFEIELTTEQLFRIWSGDDSLMSALFQGSIKTKGNIIRAQPFIDLFHQCGDIYRTIQNKE